MDNSHIGSARSEIAAQLQVLEDAARNARLYIELDPGGGAVGQGFDDVDRASRALDMARVTYNVALGEALGKWADGPPESAEDVIRQWQKEQQGTSQSDAEAD